MYKKSASRKKTLHRRPKKHRLFFVALHCIVVISTVLQMSMFTHLWQTPTVLAETDGEASGSISGVVFEDHNGDGVRDAGDQGLSGIRMQITQGLYDFTASDGSYTITGIPAGLYSVIEFTPTNWITTGGVDNVITDIEVKTGEDTGGVHFGNFQTTKLTGHKFNDLNNNGVNDSEPPLEKVTMVLSAFDLYYSQHPEQYGSNDGYLEQASTETDEQGHYSFGDLGPGLYRVTEKTPIGWSQTTPSSGHYTNLLLRSGQPEINLDFGNHRQPDIHTPGITVHKMVDVNGNGKWDDAVDGGDAKGNDLGFRWGYSQKIPVGSVRPIESSPFATQRFGTSVEVDGYTTIVENTIPGYHYVGWIYTEQGDCTQPYSGWPSIQPESMIALTLCNAHDTGTIEGYKWVDSDGDGFWDEGEPTKAGIEIRTTHGQSAITDQNGYYQIQGVPTGRESVIEVTPKGWINTNYNNVAGDVEVTKDSSVRVDFGNFAFATIAGVKFNDLNHNGVREEQETGLSGWEIRLEKFDTYYFTHTEEYGVNDGYLPAASTVTDAGGSYTFSDLTPGKYRIRETQQEGWTQSAPITGEYTDIQPMSGQKMTDRDFGNWQLNADPQHTTLSISKTNNIPTIANPGTTVGYTVTVTNTGPVDAQNVTVTDTLPSGMTLTFNNQSSNVFSLGTIAAGKSKVLVYTARIAPNVLKGTLTNSATAQADNADAVTAKSSIDVRTPSVLGAASGVLQIEKHVDRSSTTTDSDVVYTVTVKNGGESDISNVTITDTLPDGFVFATNSSQRQWTIDLLSAQQEKTYTYAVHIPADAANGTLVNKVVALADFIDPVEAQATITIRTPQVLGLATTGISGRDRILFTLAFLASALGFGLLRHRTDHELAV